MQNGAEYAATIVCEMARLNMLLTVHILYGVHILHSLNSAGFYTWIARDALTMLLIYVPDGTALAEIEAHKPQRSCATAAGPQPPFGDICVLTQGVRR